MSRHLLLTLCCGLLGMTASLRTEQQFPTGTYVAGSFTLTFSDDGTHSVSDNGKVAVTGTYAVKGDQITLTDKDGDYACPEPGRYQWKYEGKALTFKALLDDCSGRVDGLTAQEWIRK
jgi:hypothetical protein